MSEIVHITFEKLTGMKGDIEGDFLVSPVAFGTIIDTRLPLVFISEAYKDKDCKYKADNTALVFRQGNKHFTLEILPMASKQAEENYVKHFEMGVNFLIKEWSVKNGVNLRGSTTN